MTALQARGAVQQQMTLCKNGFSIRTGTALDSFVALEIKHQPAKPVAAGSSHAVPMKLVQQQNTVRNQ